MKRAGGFPRFARWVAIACGKISLRRTVCQLAMAGNVPMLIWLSKQHLGFSDKIPFDLSKIPDELLKPEIRRRLSEAEAKEKNACSPPMELLPNSVK